jgi:hypothetical protein
LFKAFNKSLMEIFLKFISPSRLLTEIPKQVDIVRIHIYNNLGTEQRWYLNNLFFACISVGCFHIWRLKYSDHLSMKTLTAVIKCKGIVHVTLYTKLHIKQHKSRLYSMGELRCSRRVVSSILVPTSCY